MLYKKSKEVFNDELFKNPTSEYRAAPFWAWNDKLEKDELLRQIEVFKKMGLGGFHMHVRSGLQTPYLGEEFMELISSCVDKAKSENMLAYLYDEDRWASGPAGGFVTENPLFRAKHVEFTTVCDEEVEKRKAYSGYAHNSYIGAPENYVTDETGFKQGKKYLLAVYDVSLDKDGYLKTYKKIAPASTASGKKWYAYVSIDKDSGWFNGYGYIDVMNKAACEKFVDVTYNAYLNKVGSEFGKTVPSIFTDEPHFEEFKPLAYSKISKSAQCAWTTDLPSTFYNENGYDIVEKLPEVFFKQKNAPCTVLYKLLNHLTVRFKSGFIKTCGDWCKAHDLNFTGHLLYEDSLKNQTAYVGETMRLYPEFGLPGIDMLCNSVELTTAKQTQSIVRQYKKEGMTSELYGVTGWDFDFRGHKFQGDWQAALGVTLRVPHLSWYSMRGSAKRDYPASISYQSAWYDEYKFVEDHFARLNVCLTRGKPLVNVGVIFPIESEWINYSAKDLSVKAANEVENNFQNLTRLLLNGMIDFDFISEGLLAETPAITDNKKFKVGDMAYKTVVVPALKTIRKTTLDALKAFAENGGHILLAGAAPALVDGVKNAEAEKFFKKHAEKCEFTELSILDALERDRYVSLKYASGNNAGANAEGYLHQLRTDGEDKWLFIARFVEKNRYDFSSCLPDDLYITLNEKVYPVVYDTISGELKTPEYKFEHDKTIIRAALYGQDSLLLKLTKDKPAKHKAYDDFNEFNGKTPDKTVDFKEAADFTLAEENVLVLDIAKWSEDGKIYNAEEEILKIDEKLRKIKGYPYADGCDVQPWRIKETGEKEYVYLKYSFISDIALPVTLATEGADEIIFNGKSVPVVYDGYFVDKHIFKVRLGDLKKSENELIIKAPFSKRTSLENNFILGDFGVFATGATAKIVKKPEKITFGSVINQGLPFYGSKLTYKTQIKLNKKSDVIINSTLYRGALISVSVDDKDAGKIVYAPYKLLLKDLPRGAHTVKFTLDITRVNTFNGLHNCSKHSWVGPDYWYATGSNFAYEYQLKDNGILKSPVIEVYEK